MNLATLVSSLVLAASTATAGLLVAPPLPFGHTAADTPSGPAVSGDGWCVGFCGDEASQGNSTHGNQTTPPPPPPGGHGSGSGNQTHGNQTSPPAHGNATASPAPATCGVQMHDSQDIEGPSHLSWSWMVGTRTTNLTVNLQVDGTWVPLGGGLRVTLVDGQGHVVASAANSGNGLPMDYTVIHYSGSRSTGLEYGQWHVNVDADGVLGSAYLDVHGEC